MHLSSRITLFLYILILVALVFPTHVVGIDQFSDIDEPFWVINGSNFYYALTHGDFANTVYEYHPGVTTTWIVAAGMLAEFPQYRGLGQGYFDPYKWNFEDFMRMHGERPLDLVRTSRIIQAIILIVLALLLFFLIQLIVDRLVALLAVALAFNAPFFLGHSRLLNNEAMMASFIIVSLAAMYVYLRHSRKLIYLLISGVAFGLAQLTKSPSIVLVGLVGLMLIVGLFDRLGGKTLSSRLLEATGVFTIWLIAAVVVFFLLWPGMWVDPGRMLYEIYGNAFSYAFQGARLEVTKELVPSSFSLDLSVTGIRGYFARWVLRSTLVTWLGLLLALGLLVFRVTGRRINEFIGYLTLAAILFILMFGIAHGRNSPHYIMTAFVCLDVVAGIGWGSALEMLRGRGLFLEKQMSRAVLVALVIGAQIIPALPYYPYYFTYPNPLARNYAPGYGEGLDLAADYLAQKPDADGLRAFVYNGMGTFSYFFPGKVQAIKSPYFMVDGMPDVIQRMRWADYLVVYVVAQKRIPQQKAFLDALEKVRPEHAISLYGTEYVRIYRTSDIPESIYEQLAKQEGGP